MVRFNNYSTSVNIVVKFLTTAKNSLVSTAPVLRFYSVDEPVTVSVDASSKGLGVVLLQNGQPVAYGSKALSETQKKYAHLACRKYTFPYPERTRYANHTVSTLLTYVEDAV
jgi:hypothetical protein